MARIMLDEVTRDVSTQRILDGVSFEAAEGEFVGLIGPSGSGKTSVIRAIAGFDQVTSGSIYFDGDDITEAPVQDRDVGIVTQGNNLFPNRRVRGNLLFPLFARGVRRDEANMRVEAESRANALSEILDRWPATLSGGEQQLTQIARALIRRPRVFLMDEPLANLDPPTRARLRKELVAIQKGYGVTTVYVAHRAEEIMSMPDRVVALDHGRVVQTGTPLEVYTKPASLAIARSTGPLGTLTGTLAHDGNGLVVSGPGMAFRLLPTLAARHVGHKITLAVRSEHVKVSTSGQLTCTAGGLNYESSRMVRDLVTPSGMIGTLDHEIPEGSTVSVWLDKWHLYDQQGLLIT